MIFDNEKSFDATATAETSEIALKRCKHGLSSEVIDRLLAKLGSDDGFRELFQSDPRAALLSIGHCTPDAIRGLPGIDPVLCMGVTSLASKEAIQAASASLRKQMHIFAPFDYLELHSG